ncbi:hypothetical protein B9Z19DRAFT_788872 [Tuber borchii]|uniref:Uncharacterized protein n=1 Tax=Tuber borchii TaxID=42251 RepID=A0A2T6ZWH9_TUBBO|nr:hypothetical protein B9Z19DRAFT_788872 [Tuber borchii]
MRSKNFDQIISPHQESQQRLSQGPRLGIIDFPQCYDTYDCDLLHLMGEKLGLQKEGETTFIGPYLERVRELPGQGRFRTGVSLLVPFKEPAELSRSESRFILFASFPYFGGSSQGIVLDSESESVKLLDFKRLGLDLPSRRTPAGKEERDDIREISAEEEKDDIGKILVHQARYMIFDNNIMATFRSKEDSAKDQVPLHRFQERVGAFRSTIHMIANRMELESKTLGTLQASLCKLEEDIDEMILEAKTCERNQGMRRNPADLPLQRTPEPGVTPTDEDRRRMIEEDDQARQNNVRERKQRKVRGLLTSLNGFSAALFAVINLAERQIAILQDLHSLFLTSYRTKTREYEKGYPLRRNPFHRNVAPIPILSENTEQIWPNTLDTIDEVVRERKSFIRKVKQLVGNMDIRRKIFAAFLKSEQANAAPSGKTAQETTGAVKRTEDAIKETTGAIKGTEAVIQETQAVIKQTQAELVQQGQTLSGFTLVTTAFLPLSFCTSYFGMQTVKGFGGTDPTISLLRFWLNTGPVLVVILLLTFIIILWKRQSAAELRACLKEKLSWSSRKNNDLEKQNTSQLGLISANGP